MHKFQFITTHNEITSIMHRMNYFRANSRDIILFGNNASFCASRALIKFKFSYSLPSIRVFDVQLHVNVVELYNAIRPNPIIIMCVSLSISHDAFYANLNY